MTLAVAETLVAAFCEAAGLYRDKRRPRVDVYDVARRVGAIVEHSSQLTEDGRVEDSPWTTRIVLRESAPEDRTRFTLAHELGHLLLSDPEVLRLVHVALDEQQVDVERMCNAFAAELLMPQEWLRHHFAGRPERFEVIDEVMTRAGVSYSAALTRLAIVLGWRASLLSFQRRRDWAPIVIAGGSARLHGIELRGDAAQRLAGMSAKAAVDRYDTIELALRGRTQTVHGEFRRSEGGVLCLALLSRGRS